MQAKEGRDQVAVQLEEGEGVAQRRTGQGRGRHGTSWERPRRPSRGRGTGQRRAGRGFQR